MKCYKVIIIIICLIQTSFGEERRKPIPMDQLTDHSSPFYVPHPYPKTREEIMANLKFQVKRKNEYLDSRRRKLKINRKKNKPGLLDILEGKTSSRVGKIIKVQNRKSYMAHDYNWYIFIMDENDEAPLVLNMKPNGICSGSTSIPCPSQGCHTVLLKTRVEILQILSGEIGRPISKKEIKQLELVHFDWSSNIGKLLPVWEIVFTDGSIYYYSFVKEKVFEIDKRIQYKKINNGFFDDPQYLVPNGCNYLVDTINDEILVLKVL
jgi:hypothetical protein